MRRSKIVAVTTALSLSLAACHSDDMVRPTQTGDQPSDLDVAFCGAPAWVAFQDGSGAWTHAQATTAGQVARFHHSFLTRRAGIAIARDLSDGLTVLSVLYGAPNELTIVSDTAGSECGDAMRKTILGTVAPLGQNEVARLTAGNGPGDVVSLGTGFDFKIEGLGEGPHELLATRIRRNTDGSTSLAGIILRRIAALPDSATIPLLDFDSAEAFQPVAHTVTFGGANGVVVSGLSGLTTEHGSNNVAFFSSPTGSATYVAIPDAQLQTADLQSISATSAPVGNVTRGFLTYFHSAADRTITFGAVPPPPDITIASSSPNALRMRARFAAQADYDRLTSINYQQGQNTIVAIAMTAAYASADGYDLTIPDLATADGFQSRWALRPTGQLLWTSTRIGGTLSPNFNATPRDGATRRTASDAGFITP